MAERRSNISSQSTSNAPAVTGASAIDAKKPTIPAASETAAAPAPTSASTAPAINSAGVPTSTPNQGALDVVAKGAIPTGHRLRWFIGVRMDYGQAPKMLEHVALSI